MKIGLLTHSVNPRGGVVHTLELAKALHEAGHEVTVMAPAMPGQRFFRPSACQISFVAVQDTPANTLELVRNRIEAFKWHLTQVLPAQTFDVLHAHDGMGGNALADLKENGTIDGFVRTVHHLDAFKEPELAAWQIRSVKQASQVLCVSHMWQKQLLTEWGIHAHEVCNGVDTKRFAPAPQIQDQVLANQWGIASGQRPILLSVGGIESRKNTVRLLQAFLLWRQQPEFAQAQWVIAGGASLLNHAQALQSFNSELQAAGLRVGPGESVVITGPLPDEAMPSLYRLADVVAMPSLQEGFGLVVLEALCSGKPVVASRISPFIEHLTDADVAFADPLNPPDIASALTQAWHRRGDAQIAASANRLASHFNWARSARQHEAIYQRLQQKEPIPCL